jgi:hypothetical protein
MPVQAALVQLTARHVRCVRSLYQRQQGRKFFRQRTDDAQGPYGPTIHPRNSRRRILPTGVLGNSVRNSTTRGRL